MRWVWGKPLQWGMPVPDPASIYAGMGTGMEMILRGGMGMVKQSPALPRPVAIPRTHTILHS